MVEGHLNRFVRLTTQVDYQVGGQLKREVVHKCTWLWGIWWTGGIGLATPRFAAYP